MLFLTIQLLTSASAVAALPSDPSLDVELSTILQQGQTITVEEAKAVNAVNLTAFYAAVEEHADVLPLPEGWEMTAEETLAWWDGKPVIDESLRLNPFTKRAGCDQGDCPDFHAKFDFLQVLLANPDQRYGITYNERWYARIDDCGCQRQDRPGPGCFYVSNACGRPQEMCVDIGNRRGHRIWRDNGHKTCYAIGTGTAECKNWKGDTNKWETSYAAHEVACTW